MVNKTTLIAGLTACALAFVCLKPFSQKEGNRMFEVSGEPETEGDGDNPNARAAWEFMRLVDPTTGKIPIDIRRQELAYATTLPKADEYSPLARKSNVVTWDVRGPLHFGGRTRAMAMDVTDENILLAGSISGGMWRSTDGGASWIRTTGAAQYPGISGVAQDTRPGKTNVWYYSTGELFGPSASGTGAFYLGNGIFKSVDGGLTWASLASTANTTPQSFDNLWDVAHNVATNPANTAQDEVFAATVGAIYRSVNGGTSWTAVRGGGTSDLSYYTDIAVTSTGVIYATLSTESGSGRKGNHPGIWRSVNGTTWANITPAGFPQYYTRIAIGISPADENQVYFLAQTPDGGNLIPNFLGASEGAALWKYKYVSGDGSASGGIWNDYSNNLPQFTNKTENFYSQGGYDLLVKVKPNDTNAVFIGGTNLYRSTDGFTTNTNITMIGGYGIGSGYPTFNSYPNHHSDQHQVLFSKINPSVMINSNDGGIYKTTANTTPSITWSTLNNGYSSIQFYTTAIKQNVNDDVIVGGAQDNNTWITTSATSNAIWKRISGGDGSYCAISNTGDMYYTSIQNGKIYKSQLDVSGNVLAKRRIDPIGAKNYLFINPFVLDPNNDDIMYLPAGREMWRHSTLSSITLDGGNDSISTGWTKFTDTTLAQISAITACKTPVNRVYIGTAAKNVYRIDNANSASPTMTSITAPAFPATANVSSIAVHPTNGDVIMVTFSNYGIQSVFITYDGGVTWSPVGGNLEPTNNKGPSVRWGSIMPVGTDTVYLLATSTGLYGTNHIAGKSTKWVQQSPTNIGSIVVDMIATRPSDGFVAVATHGNGMYSAHITSAIDVVNVKENAFASNDLIITNYPNPFSDRTNISVNLANTERVLIKIFDSKGAEVQTVYSGAMYAGKNEVQFDGSSLNKGIYFCCLVKGSTTKVLKMLKQ